MRYLEKQIYEDGSLVSGCQGLGGRAVIVRGYRLSFSGGENVLTLNTGAGFTTPSTSKKPLHT